MIIVNLILAIIPSILIGLYLYKKDHNKESKGILIKLFFGGIGSCFLTLAITYGIGAVFPGLIPSSQTSATTNIIVLFFQVMLGVALIEEFSKWFFAYFIGYKSREFDEIYDILLYCGFVALGFATFENVLYVFTSEQSITTALLRAVTAVPGHVCDAIFMGYYLGIAKRHETRGDKSNKNKYVALAIIVPMFTHGLYDFLIMSGSGLLVLVWLVFVVLVYIYVIKKIRDISKAQKTIYHAPEDNTVPVNNVYYPQQQNTFGMNSMYGNQPGSYTQMPAAYPTQAIDNANINHVVNTYCPNCGAHVPTGNFCGSCGTKIR